MNTTYTTEDHFVKHITTIDNWHKLIK